jgi:glucose/arabinose dehydrogenase
MATGARVAVAIVALAAVACANDVEEPPSSAPRPATSAPGRSSAPAERPSGPVRVGLRPVATFDQPVGMAVRSGDDALYIVQKAGTIIAQPSDDSAARPVLDISDEVSQGGEQGLLGIAFSPDGDYLYTNHTDPDGDTRITEWRMRGGRADSASRREILRVDQPFSNHNGGNLAFGPDGFLYIGLGDGGSAGDPMGNSQSMETLLGKMLRIDPRPADDRAYDVPDDNPFVDDSGALPEIWAFGLRNPWRYSFDRDTGDLWIADVGQGAREEINRQPAGVGGQNYGWDRLEGTEPFEGDAPSDATPPIFEYGRDRGGTVIGGYVYRGNDIPGLVGAYVFGDLFNADLRALRVEDGEVQETELGASVENLVAFGEDNEGELYALSLAGAMYRIVPA